MHVKPHKSGGDGLVVLDARMFHAYAYITDDRDLFEVVDVRLVGPPTKARRSLVLENCKTFASRVLTERQLEQRKFRYIGRRTIETESA